MQQIDLTDEDRQDDEQIRAIQLRIQNNESAIKDAITEYQVRGRYFESRNLKWALQNAREPVEELTEFQALNLDWCVEIMGLAR